MSNIVFSTSQIDEAISNPIDARPQLLGTIVDELLKADDARISGFTDSFNGHYVAERVLTMIKDREKLNKLQVEKAMEHCKEVFLDMVKKGDIKTVEKSLPRIEDNRKNWIAEALAQKETSKMM